MSTQPSGSAEATGRRPGFHVMAKPSGAACNLACRYCFYLAKEALYPAGTMRMSDAVMEAYIGQVLAGATGGEATITWQGGEPTLMGLPFFERAVATAERLRPPGVTVNQVIQTNGTLLDETWAAFLRQHRFLVGISLDGPPDIHDAYRVNRGGRGTHAAVLRGIRLLQEHGVDYNVLTTVHAANERRALDVYRHLRDEVGARYLQFIPIVERIPGDPAATTDRSVSGPGWGRFLVDVFDEWIRRDVGTMFVNLFDVALGAWVGAPPSLCVHAPTCGDQVALEHTGDVYACDHFVDPEHLLGNLLETPLPDLVAMPAQRRFGLDKRDLLPAKCRSCDVRFACHGGCPKDRFAVTADGEPGLNVLCAGYETFFHHVDRAMRLMAELLRTGRPPAAAMGILAHERARLIEAASRAGRNDPCPCGSGRKAKRCHGAQAS